MEDGSGGATWVIKHSADDYKTGATYGERPPLPLRASLTPEIDDFLARWRPALLRRPPEGDAADEGAPSSPFLFLQPRTGNPLTANSVYQIVSVSERARCFVFCRRTRPRRLRRSSPLLFFVATPPPQRSCYKYKQKKTNPHLLRDMIVTHVRKNADASEKELEALALFMGHSIQMQRESYDRRTLEQKVSPAVKLMQDVSSLGQGSGE